MTNRTKTAAMLLLTVLAGLVWLFGTPSGRYMQFLVGGALVNLGYRMQDHLTTYDFEHENLQPEDIWQEMLRQNALAANVRQRFPRTTRHPLVALVVCMDARIDTNELTGDTRRLYYIIRTAGSVLSEREEEMLELAVDNGVKLIVLTTHSDCAAEKVAASSEARQRFPALANAVEERDQRFRDFLARPAISSRIAKGELAVKCVTIDTLTEHMSPDSRVP